jgi:hypothetical protein
MPNTIFKFYVFIHFFKNILLQSVCYYKVSKFFGFLSISNEKLDWSKKTVFILGGSWESSRLTKRQWSHVKKNASIGLNQWFLHKFEPVFLSVENSNKFDKKIKNYFNTQLQNYLSSSKTKIIVKDLEFSFFNYKSFLPFREKIFLLKKKYLLGKTKQELQKSIEYQKTLLNFNLDGFFLSCRASVITAISVACFFGAKNIVLVGFGSLSNKYFWETKSFKRRKNMLEPIQLNLSSVQTTFNKKIFRPSIQEVFKILKQFYRDEYKCKIFRGTPSPKLIKIFPAYSWPKY